MSKPHRMHLRGPWHYEWVGPAVGGNDPTESIRRPVIGRAQLPAEWRSLFGDAAGKVRFRRRFHRPTNLDRHERVFLVFDGVGGEADVLLNGQPLGTIARNEQVAEFETTELLQQANELVAEIEFDPAAAYEQPGGLWAPVAIEIRSDRSIGG